MPWPFRSRRSTERADARRADARSAEVRAGDGGRASAAGRPFGQWRQLPALTGVIAAQPTSGSRQFTQTLPSRWQQPPVLGRLGHNVRAEAPSGTVSGLTVLPSLPSVASGPGVYPASAPLGPDGAPASRAGGENLAGGAGWPLAAPGLPGAGPDQAVAEARGRIQGESPGDLPMPGPPDDAPAAPLTRPAYPGWDTAGTPSGPGARATGNRAPMPQLPRLTSGPPSRPGTGSLPPRPPATSGPHPPGTGASFGPGQPGTGGPEGLEQPGEGPEGPPGATAQSGEDSAARPIPPVTTPGGPLPGTAQPDAGPGPLAGPSTSGGSAAGTPGQEDRRRRLSQDLASQRDQPVPGPGPVPGPTGARAQLPIAPPPPAAAGLAVEESPAAPSSAGAGVPSTQARPGWGEAQRSPARQAPAPPQAPALAAPWLERPPGPPSAGPAAPAVPVPGTPAPGRPAPGVPAARSGIPGSAAGPAPAVPGDRQAPAAGADAPLADVADQAPATVDRPPGTPPGAGPRRRRARLGAPLADRPGISSVPSEPPPGPVTRAAAEPAPPAAAQPAPPATAWPAPAAVAQPVPPATARLAPAAVARPVSPAVARPAPLAGAGPIAPLTSRRSPISSMTPMPSRHRSPTGIQPGGPGPEPRGASSATLPAPGTVPGPPPYPPLALGVNDQAVASHAPAALDMAASRWPAATAVPVGAGPPGFTRQPGLAGTTRASGRDTTVPARPAPPRPVPAQPVVAPPAPAQPVLPQAAPSPAVQSGPAPSPAVRSGPRPSPAVQQQARPPAAAAGGMASQAPSDPAALDQLAHRLYGRIRSQLTAELLADRERAHLLTDL